MRSWSRGSDRDIEAQLRAARPEPTPEVTRAIADRVRPRRSLLKGAGRVPLVPVAGVTALAATVVVSLGGATAAVSTAGDALNLRAKKAKVAQAPSINQYEENVIICTAGTTENTVPLALAQLLVATSFGVIQFGPCPDDADAFVTRTRTFHR